MSETIYEKICKINYKLDLNDPLKSYLDLIKITIKSDLLNKGSREDTNDMWKMVCNSVRETMWKLLFDSENPSKDQCDKAAALLKAHKVDAKFFNPTQYNTWIYDLRDELLKRNMLDFWRDVVVANELGIAWARDSDMYDDFEDPEPVEFYNHGGCKAAWLEEKENINLMDVGAETAYDKICKINYKLDLNDPLKSYLALVEITIKSDLLDEGTREDVNEMWTMVCDSVRETMWKLLFDSENPSKDQCDKAAALLKEHKVDAAFFNPTEYNTWIYDFRDELLKRNMLDFWRDVMVANELGIAWARDSDMYDDFEDPEPVDFYKFGGCEAAWLKEEENKPSAPPLNLMNVGAEKSSEAPKTLRKITMENAVEDYRNNMIAQGEIDPDDEDAYKKIFAEVREMLWQILFSEPTLSEENSKKAVKLMFRYKLDACYFSPYDYNDWIPKVRDELFNRKYFDFWKIVCEKKMGLCCHKDSDYFDDKEDTKPEEFYKSGDELMKQHEKK